EQEVRQGIRGHRDLLPFRPRGVREQYAVLRLDVSELARPAQHVFREQRLTVEAPHRRRLAIGAGIWDYDEVAFGELRRIDLASERVCRRAEVADEIYRLSAALIGT